MKFSPTLFSQVTKSASAYPNSDIRPVSDNHHFENSPNLAFFSDKDLREPQLRQELFLYGHTPCRLNLSRKKHRIAYQRNKNIRHSLRYKSSFSGHFTRMVIYPFFAKRSLRSSPSYSTCCEKSDGSSTAEISIPFSSRACNTA